MDPVTTESAFSITPTVTGSFSWDGSQTLTFDPTDPLDGSTKYTVKIASTATDFSANNLDGNGNGIFDFPPSLDDYSWNLTTHEDELPIVNTISPVRDAQNVSLTSNIQIRLSEPMNQSTVEQAFTITPSTAGSINWFENNLTFQPVALLLNATTFTIKLNSTCTDIFNNPLDGNRNTLFEGSPDDDYSWSFTTIEITPPKISSVSPVDLAQDVLINVDVQTIFSEPMNKTSVELAFTISPAVLGYTIWSGGDTIFTFSPETNFNGSTLYTINITTAAMDMVGNQLDGNGNGIDEGSPTDDYSWSFTTAIIPDDEPPYVAKTVPEDDEIDVNKSTAIIISFSEPMNKAMTEGGFTIIPFLDGIFVWDTDGLVLTFTPDEDYNYDTEYTVRLMGGTARDLASNTLDGNNNTISEGSPGDDYSWSFTTEPEPIPEIIYPYIVSVTPLDAAVDIPVDTNIEILFSKNMNMATTQFAFSISPAVTGTFDWDQTKMIFNPTADLEYETTYTVLITSDATDTDTNPLDGNNNSVPDSPYDDYSWVFITTRGSDSVRYNISISGVSKITIKLEENKTFPITITNLGTLGDVITPGLNAGAIDEYASLSDTDSRAIGAGNSWAINLNLAIPYDAITGTFNITIEATSLNGGLTRVHNVEVKILPLDKSDEPSSDDTDDNGLDSVVILGLILVIIIVVIIIIIVAIMLRKRKREQSAAPGMGAPLPPPLTAAPVGSPPTDYVEPHPGYAPAPGQVPSQPYHTQPQPGAVPALPPPEPEPVKWDDEMAEE
jgi:hypothetical protein